MHLSIQESLLALPRRSRHAVWRTFEPQRGPNWVICPSKVQQPAHRIPWPTPQAWETDVLLACLHFRNVAAIYPELMGHLDLRKPALQTQRMKTLGSVEGLFPKS